MEIYKSNTPDNAILPGSENEIDEFSAEMMHFIPLLIDAINSDDSCGIIELANTSNSLLDIKQDKPLPPICFELPTFDAFVRVFHAPAEGEFKKDFFLMTLTIFRNIYLNKFISNVDLIPPSIFLGLWESVHQVQPDVAKVIIETIREMLKNSSTIWPNFIQSITNNVLFETLSNVDNETYLSLLVDYISYCSVHKKFKEVDLLQCHRIIYSLFESYCNKYLEYSKNQIENETEYQFYRQLTMQLLPAFKNIVMTDKLINARPIVKYKIPIVHQIIREFLLFRFLCIGDEEIYYENIRVLSSLCEITTTQAITENGFSLKRKNHIYFQSANPKINLFLHFLTEFNKAIEFPQDSPYVDIPAQICTIIIRLSKQILDSHQCTGIRSSNPNNGKRELSVMDLLFCDNFFPKMKWLFENQSSELKYKIINFFYFMLEGPAGRILYLLNSEIVPLMASILNSDEPKLLKKAFQFFNKLSEIYAIQKFEYPLADEIVQNEVIELIDGFIYETHSIEYQKSLLDLAEQTKNQILVNILGENPNGE